MYRSNTLIETESSIINIMAHRYFLTTINGDVATVQGAEASHLVKVMRIKEGDSVILTDRSGWDYNAVAKEIGKDEITFDIISKEKNPAEPTKKLTVYMALPKSDKLEFITQKMCVDPLLYSGRAARMQSRSLPSGNLPSSGGTCPQDSTPNRDPITCDLVTRPYPAFSKFTRALY